MTDRSRGVTPEKFWRVVMIAVIILILGGGGTWVWLGRYSWGNGDGYKSGYADGLAQLPPPNTITEMSTITVEASSTTTSAVGSISTADSSQSSAEPTEPETIPLDTVPSDPPGPPSDRTIDHGILLPDDVMKIFPFEGSLDKTDFTRNANTGQVLAWGLDSSQSYFMCSDKTIPASEFVFDSVNTSWLSTKYMSSNTATQGWGTEIVSYQEGQARPVLDDILAAAVDCQAVVDTPHQILNLGQYAFRLSKHSPASSNAAASYEEHVFVQYKDVVIHVALITGLGDSGVFAEKLAVLAYSKLRNFYT